MTSVFKGNFTQQEPIPQKAIDAAVAVMQSGRLHRYNTLEGEVSETVQLEIDFAKFVDAEYCLAVASGGYALTTALRAVGVKHGDKVLTNAFTLAPVPGSITGAGGVPVFVECTKDLVLDLEDLLSKIKSSNAKFLMLSHMRGHIVDMDALMDICDANDVIVVEDCAHTMGAHWDKTPSGRHGKVGCYSCQTFKHINSGEGGLFVTDDAEVMARATMLSGSYMLYESHLAGAPTETFEDIRLDTPNCSGRMDNLRAAILRPQLEDLGAQATAWNDRFKVLEDALKQTDGIRLPQRPTKEHFVASSFQFFASDLPVQELKKFIQRCSDRGIQLKWFGADQPVGFTSRHDSWRYVAAHQLPQTDAVLSTLLDMRIPLTFSLDDCSMIAQIIKEEIANV